MKSNSKRSPLRSGRPDDELLIGAHESIAGGVHTAFERGNRAGCRVLQVFTKNSNQWKAKPLRSEDIASYKTAASKSNISFVMAHSSYLINLCAVDPVILQKSRDAYLEEIRRCDAFGIGYFNFHPGAHMGAGEAEGIEKIVESLNWIHAESPDCNVRSILETTAGQGSSIGHRFEELRAIIDGVEDRKRMGVCIDTCHIFAAGYDIRTEQAYDETIEEFDGVVGLDRLIAIHANDSKKGLGSRVDRHEHIGKGAIGRNGFQFMMQDERLKRIPKILETPKGEDLKEDIMNLDVLRKLAVRKKVS